MMPNGMSRRKVLAGLGATTGVALLGSVGNIFLNSYAVADEPPKFILGNLLPEPNDILYYREHTQFVTNAPDLAGFLTVFELATGATQKFPVPTFAHVPIYSDKNINLVAGTTKWGHRGFIFDLKTKKNLHTLIPPDGGTFFGHGSFYKNGKYLLVTGIGAKYGTGHIFIYETQTGKCVDAITVFGAHPHDCFWREKDRILAVAAQHPWKDAKIKGRVNFVDIYKKKIIKSYPVPFAAHIKPLDKDHIMVGGQSHSGEFAFGILNLKTEKFENLDLARYARPQLELNGEALSFIKLGSDLFISTSSKSGDLIAWNPKTGQFACKKLPDHTMGMLNINSKIYFSRGIFDAELLTVEFNSQKFEFENFKSVSKFLFNSGHIIAI